MLLINPSLRKIIAVVVRLGWSNSHVNDRVYRTVGADEINETGELFLKGSSDGNGVEAL